MNEHPLNTALLADEGVADRAPAARLNRRRFIAGAAGAGLAQALWLPQAARAASASYEVVHEFTDTARGAYPASLMFRSDGVLHGITEAGGRQNRGTIFRLAGGRFQMAHSFFNGEAQRGDVNVNKLSPLAEGPDGELYGNTLDGGNFQKGMAYKLNSTDACVQLHHFTGGETDGMSPYEQMVMGADGAFYGAGVAVFGGWNQATQAYRMALDGSITQLARIGSNISGLSKLTLASDGNFYAMTELGGVISRGGAYRMAPDGALDMLYSVGLERPAQTPSGGFVQHPNGMLYGTTENDPEGNGFGAVLRMTMDGQAKVLHRFGPATGSRPFGVTVGSNGRLYGVARSGGPTGNGLVYQLTTAGRFTVLHAFTSAESPVGRLAEGPDGRLYGVTQYGPSLGYGSVYAIGAA